MRLLATVALVLLQLSAATAFADGAGYAFKASGEQPLLHFTRLHHRVRGGDDHEALWLYADGRVVVHTPFYMKNPGTFEYRLSDKAMQAVLARLDRNALMTTDWAAAKAARDQAARQRNASSTQRFHVSDLTQTRITLNFASFGKRGEKGARVDQRIVWNDVPVDAQLFVADEAVQRLARVEQYLLSLTDHSRRNSVRVTGGR